MRTLFSLIFVGFGFTEQPQVVPVPAKESTDNIYRTAKIGDFAIHDISVNVGGTNLTGTVTQKITVKTDKEVIIKIAGSFNGMEIPTQEQKIDLTKPYAIGIPPNLDPTFIEKLKDGKEKLKINGKTHDCDWATYKIKIVNVDAQVKVWTTPEIMFGMVKMTMTAEGMNMTMNIVETGNKK